MFELTTSNLDQELREQKIADGLRRRQLLETTETRSAAAQMTVAAAPRTIDAAPTARFDARRAAAQR